jgi:hypothetical protein
MNFLSGKKLASHIEGNLAAILDGDVTMARKVLKAKQQALFQSNDGSVDLKCNRFLQQLNVILGESNKSLSIARKCMKALQLAIMTNDARKKLSLLLDVTGHQIL